MSYQQVANLGDIAVGTAKRVDLAEPICLVRTGPDTVKAIHDVCSHQEYSLAEGWVGTNDIECALHGSTFDLDTGDPSSLPAVDPVPVYACKVTGDDVLVDLDAQLNDAAPPRH